MDELYQVLSPDAMCASVAAVMEVITRCQAKRHGYTAHIDTTEGTAVMVFHW